MLFKTCKKNIWSLEKVEEDGMVNIRVEEEMFYNRGLALERMITVYNLITVLWLYGTNS